MRVISIILVLPLTLVLACSDDDGDDAGGGGSGTMDSGAGPADAGTGGDADAGSGAGGGDPDSGVGDSDSGNGGGSGELLGTLCNESTPCPEGGTCVFQPIPDGSMTEGYCSPTCETNDDCTADYTGPGRALCFSMNVCTLSCMVPNGEKECPAGTECLPTKGPTFVCAVPAS